MTARAKFLIIGLGLVLLGALFIFVFDFRGAEPAFECVPENAASSGFADPDQGGCPVGMESYNAWNDWHTSFRWNSIVGAVLFLGGLAAAAIGLTKRPKAEGF